MQDKITFGGSISKRQNIEHIKHIHVFSVHEDSILKDFHRKSVLQYIFHVALILLSNTEIRR